jgi:Grx4 family monothiol glutaredoxin
VTLLKDVGISFSSFDILADEQVRQGLKTYANWPTYPQLWIKGELVGGLDIVKEMAANGELQQMLPVRDSSSSAKDLKALTTRSPLMIFIKGTPTEPRCGFSRQLITLLDELDVKYDYFDILTDDEVREGLKQFSNWPTYPQVYVRGELVGGLDIVKEMVELGDFQAMLSNSQ